MIAAIFANAHRDPKKGRPFTPADFFPSLDSMRPDLPSDGALEAKLDGLFESIGE